uniref:Uncharacterized protein n=1 Tax=Triticum urartu TaxID=4572 RepID=A0A8R7UVK6_TRIUA
MPVKLLQALYRAGVKCSKMLERRLELSASRDLLGPRHAASRVTPTTPVPTTSPWPTSTSTSSASLSSSAARTRHVPRQSLGGRGPLSSSTTTTVSRPTFGWRMLWGSRRTPLWLHARRSSRCTRRSTIASEHSELAITKQVNVLLKPSCEMS